MVNEFVGDLDLPSGQKSRLRNEWKSKKIKTAPFDNS
jgi:hypothetical protein